MAKKPKRPPPIPAHTTAERFDGGAIKIELLLQPEDAAKLTDQLVNALTGIHREE